MASTPRPPRSRSSSWRGSCVKRRGGHWRRCRHMSERGRFTVGEALKKLPGPSEERWAVVLEHGTLEVEIYAPRGADPQGPHTRDEVYVIVSGSGEFVRGDSRERFGRGDLLFVPAGVVHRFENFTDDLTMWVVFYGPEGGEKE